MASPFKSGDSSSSESSSDSDLDLSENEASVLVDVSVHVKKATKKYPAIRDHILKMLGAQGAGCPIKRRGAKDPENPMTAFTSRCLRT
jgi:hypothetical protein